MFANLRYFLLPVLNITGPVLIAFACLLLLPVFVSSLYNDGAAYGFEIAFVLCLITGLTLYVFTKRHRRELLPRDGFLLATIIWAVTPLFGAIPLMLEIPGISFTHAYFESMSGITTTCATVLSSLSELPESINFWRCMMSWLGGMGILVLAVAILPMLGVGGSQIFRAEFSGPMKESRLTPRIADTAKGLWGIYIALSFACFISYRLAGMNTYESIIHMFTTVSLGGFSSYDESFAHWNNPNIEAVAIVFMLLCGVSFSLHFFAWKKRSIVAYFKNVECLSWLSIAALTTACATGLLLMSDTSLEPLHALRLAAFNVISVISTTGYASQDFAQWPASIYILMFVVACFATCGGSTGGGMKMLRVVMLVKYTSLQLVTTAQPRVVRPMVLNGQVLADKTVLSALSFMLLWLATTVLAFLGLLLTGLDATTAFGAVLGCICNIGPGLGAVGPNANFSVLTDAQLWLCTFCMLIGRLELVTVFVLFTRSFWRA